MSAPASVANARHRSRRRHDDEQVVVLVVRNRHINSGERFENRRQRVRVTHDEHDVGRMRLDLHDEQSSVFRADLLDRNTSLRGQRLCRVLRALELCREMSFTPPSASIAASFCARASPAADNGGSVWACMPASARSA